jgi:hypothetical protein
MINSNLGAWKIIGGMENIEAHPLNKERTEISNFARRNSCNEIMTYMLH